MSKLFCVVFVGFNIFMPDSAILEIENSFIWMEDFAFTDKDIDFILRRYDFIIFLLLLAWATMKRNTVGAIGVILFHWIMFLVVILNLDKYYALLL